MGSTASEREVVSPTVMVLDASVMSISVTTMEASGSVVMVYRQLCSPTAAATWAVPRPTAWATPSDVTETMLGLSETKLTLARLAAFSGRMSGESCWAVPTVMVAA